MHNSIVRFCNAFVCKGPCVLLARKTTISNHSTPFKVVKKLPFLILFWMLSPSCCLLSHSVDLGAVCCLNPSCHLSVRKCLYTPDTGNLGSKQNSTFTCLSSINDCGILKSFGCPCENTRKRLSTHFCGAFMMYSSFFHAFPVASCTKTEVEMHT